MTRRQSPHTGGGFAPPGSRGPAERPRPDYPCAVEILGLGVDICEIARMERAIARHPTLRRRVFTPEEIAYCESKARPAESFAGRFAAREATIKALGGYRGKRWQDISVTRHPSGAPRIALTGNAKQRADALGIDRILITFTHERTNAVAFAIAVADR
jgi:holo-[acyl-carrier protein] synthase